MFLTKSSSIPIGLDISDLNLKFVQLDKVGKKIKLKSFGSIKLPPGVITKGEIFKEEEALKALEKLVSKPKYGRVNTDQAVVCLPESKTFIKRIIVEKGPNKLSDIIEQEIEKHVPLMISEIYYDWQIIEDREDDQVVLIGAALKKIVNQYSELLDKAGFALAALEIEPMAIARCLLKEESGLGGRAGIYAIIDIGATRTSMFVYSKNTIVFTVSMPISGNEINEKIAAELQIEIDQAEKAKLICGLDKDKARGVVYKLLGGMIKSLNQKINDSLEFYANHYPEMGKIEELIITGGGANIIGIDKVIEKDISFPVKVADPFVNLNDTKGEFTNYFTEKKCISLQLSKDKSKENKPITISQNLGLSYSTALGLALRNIFIEEEI